MGLLNRLYNLEEKIISKSDEKLGMIASRQALYRFNNLYYSKHEHPTLNKVNVSVYKRLISNRVATYARYMSINYGVGRE